MRMPFIPAKDIIKLTESAERDRKKIAKEKAIQILEEFNFNEKVQEAAKDQQWKLREPIFVEDYDVAVEVCNIVRDLGYTTRPMQHGYGCKCYRILIGWSQVQVRAAAGEKR